MEDIFEGLPPETRQLVAELPAEIRQILKAGILQILSEVHRLDGDFKERFSRAQSPEALQLLENHFLKRFDLVAEAWLPTCVSAAPGAITAYKRFLDQLKAKNLEELCKILKLANTSKAFLDDVRSKAALRLNVEKWLAASEQLRSEHLLKQSGQLPAIPPELLKRFEEAEQGVLQRYERAGPASVQARRPESSDADAHSTEATEPGSQPIPTLARTGAEAASCEEPQPPGQVSPTAQVRKGGKRRLAAVMFTDIVGYTAMTQRDEALALEILQEHNDILRPIFSRHGGTEIKTTGDGFLVEFDSALEAACCGVEIQRGLFGVNRDRPPGKRFQIRIGLHVGDVIDRERDVLGDPVNITQRICGQAEPGGICLSEDVARQVKNKIGVPLVKVGCPELKGIETPVEIYRVALPGERGKRDVSEPDVEVAGRSQKALGQPAELFAPRYRRALAKMESELYVVTRRHAPGPSPVRSETYFRIFLCPLNEGCIELDAGTEKAFVDAILGNFAFHGSVLATGNAKPIEERNRNCFEAGLRTTLHDHERRWRLNSLGQLGFVTQVAWEIDGVWCWSLYDAAADLLYMLDLVGSVFRETGCSGKVRLAAQLRVPGVELLVRQGFPAAFYDWAVGGLGALTLDSACVKLSAERRARAEAENDFDSASLTAEPHDVAAAVLNQLLRDLGHRADIAKLRQAIGHVPRPRDRRAPAGS